MQTGKLSTSKSISISASVNVIEYHSGYEVSVSYW